MYPAGTEVGESGLNLLTHVDTVHEVIPRGRRGESPDQPDGLGLNAAALSFRRGHTAQSGTGAMLGKRSLLGPTLEVTLDRCWHPRLLRSRSASGGR